MHHILLLIFDRHTFKDWFNSLLTQAREAKKNDGSVLLDSLEAVYPPETD